MKAYWVDRLDPRDAFGLPQKQGMPAGLIQVCVMGDYPASRPGLTAQDCVHVWALCSRAMRRTQVPFSEVVCTSCAYAAFR